MADNFEDVEIAGLDKERSRRSSGKASELFDLYLELEPSPPPAWGRIFDQIWERKLYSTMKRDARAVGGHIRISCVPDELEDTHLPALREAVADTNDKYREQAVKSRRQMKKKQQQEQEDQDRLDDLDDNLDL